MLCCQDWRKAGNVDSLNCRNNIFLSLKKKKIEQVSWKMMFLEDSVLRKSQDPVLLKESVQITRKWYCPCMHWFEGLSWACAMLKTRALLRFPEAFPQWMLYSGGSVSRPQGYRTLPSKTSKDACNCDAGSHLQTHRDLPGEQTGSLLIATGTEMSAHRKHIGLPALGICSLSAWFLKSQIL